MEFISDNLTAVIIALVGIITTGVAITVKKRRSSYRVAQKNISTKGNVAGRDNITHR